MNNLTCVWRNIYSSALATHSRHYKHFAKPVHVVRTCDFSLESLSKRRFGQHGRQPEVNRAVMDGE